MAGHVGRAAVILALASSVALASCGSPDPGPRLPRASPPASLRPPVAPTAASASQASAAPSAEVASAAPPAGGPISYVALGDSFTIGTGSSPEDAFPARLVAEWSACPVTLANLARNGFTSHDVLASEVPRLKDAAPTFVTVAAGANDIVHRVSEDAYRENLAAIFRAVKDAGVRPDRTIALPQPDWSLSPAAASFGSPASIGARIERYNAILREEATAAGARYVDLFPLMRELEKERAIASDGLHPSREAHAAWAKSLAAELGSCAGFR